MKFRSRRLRWAVVPVLAVGLLTIGITGAGAKVASQKIPEATLNGSGATFPQPFYEEAIAQFTDKNDQVTINYAGGGSGKGRQDFADQVVDFAGTDAPYPSADVEKVQGGEFDYIPTVVGPITVSFNLEGIKKLNLSGPTLSKIFQRQITTWDDSAIAKENPKADLPSTAITVARRADSSGTTQNFTTFLTKADPSGWKLGASSTISWPSDTQGGQGNSGVATIVSSTDGAIGYVDFSDAKAAGLTFASIRNQLGKYVAPTLKGASEAAATVAVNADLTYDPIYATGPTSYPITSPTWILAYKQQSDQDKGAALKAFLTYILTKGQKVAPSVDYAPLPPALTKQALAAVKAISVG
jgi:phosphate transport system substrate-binding protein